MGWFAGFIGRLYDGISIFKKIKLHLLFWHKNNDEKVFSILPTGLSSVTQCEVSKSN